MDPVAAMLQTLDLADTGARTTEDIFTGPSQWMPHGRVFGGQVLAQSVVAASRTLPDDRLIHSLHGYFLRPGDVAKGVTLGVDRIHDGRSFSTRRVQTFQDGVPIMSLIASFQVAQGGVDHQENAPEDVPEPESLPSVHEHLAGSEHPAAQFWTQARPFDIRYIDVPVYLPSPDTGERVARQAVWLKAKAKLPDDPVIHRAAMAYASDYTILEPAIRRHGLAWATPGLKMASLDHAMWWHREARADEWLLYVEDSPSAQGGRGLAHARIYRQDGKLAASVAQEGMLRVPDDVTAR
ncbi:MAG: acyl-CoA thioesterase II [Microbacteriaceae bacterium]|nr:acyl-CoA thioesterase II [Microbacteriaceae bacterium]MCL2795232.1 acyl-CoA thioesterase II [Microbacteriaceae bacterium]